MEAYTIQGQKYICLTWESMGLLCFNLAKKVLSTQQSFDRLVALAKGGWTWARTMADYLTLDKVASVQYEFYTEIAKTKGCPTLKQSLPVSVENEKLLVFDDVVDSGETLSAAVDYLKKCGATSIATASLFFKQRSKFKPDFFAKSTDAWIIFPHEIREAVDQLSIKWRQAGASDNKIKNYLSKIGLPKEQIEHFMNIQS